MKGQAMSIKLTDTQLVMLSAAARRDDRCLVAQRNLKGGAMHKVAAKLVTAGLVKEIKAKAGMAVWRRDDAIGQAYALRLTAAGAKAIAGDEGSAPDEARRGESPPNGRGPAGAAPSLSAPRDGTKLALAIGLIRRDHGATLAELVAATGWLPHTTRAALTGLRKRGYAVTIDRTDKERGSTYRIGVARGARGGEDTAQSDEPPAAPAARPKPKKAERAAASPARQAA
jgi:DNA-binding MarR family transcriptional regulator